MTVDVSGPAWAWQWHTGVVTAVIVAVAVYAHGWRQIRHSALVRERPAAPGASIPNLLLYCGGLALLVLALLSPIHTLATQFFFMRVIQHLLLVALAPCLLLIANPIPILFRGLPLSWQKWLLTRLERAANWRENVCHLTAPGPVWILLSACVWLWYDPAIHQATLDYAWLHRLETGVLFTAALLYWWHITGAWPYLHKPLPPLVRIVYTAVGVWPVKVVGIIVLFTQTQVYNYPATFRLTGLLISDQSLGGIIGWILGGTVFSATAIVLMRRWLGSEDEKPALPESAWATDEAMLAPGFRKQMNQGLSQD